MNIKERGFKSIISVLVVLVCSVIIITILMLDLKSNRFNDTVSSNNLTIQYNVKLPRYLY